MPPLCFNPCRVFSGLATYALWGSVSSGKTVFQSLSGFFRPCNEGDAPPGAAGADVSIPVGFFQALQPGGGFVGSFFNVFQSLSGFFRPCNPDTMIIAES